MDTEKELPPESVANTQKAKSSNTRLKIGMCALGAVALGFILFAPEADKKAKNPLDNDGEQFRLPNSQVAAPNGGKTKFKMDTPPKVTAPPPPPPPAFDPNEAARLEEERRRRLAEEELNRKRMQSAMIISDQQGSAAVMASANANGLSGSANLAGVQETDPNRAFAAQVGNTGVETARVGKINRMDAFVLQGTTIAGTLTTAIQSDLPGQILATTSENVYSADGRNNLIPKGSRLIGEYRSMLSRGQTRLLVIWTRVITSKGYSVELGSYGTDYLGRSGLGGVVDNHYLERFGSSVLLSIVGAGASYVSGLGAPNNYYGAYGGSSSSTDQARQQASQTISQEMTQIANTALKDSINIPPTIHVDQGTQIVVFLRRDLDFSAYYPDPLRQAIREELRRASNSKR